MGEGPNQKNNVLDHLHVFGRYTAVPDFIC